ncbi:prenyltransferase [Pleionea sediminis]|uniref:prenyltransferase n=1 Tax=Pleionea sediminis TaxID=2569479 RepID=UPI00118640B4|nr:prenyltransferase [Pleionea sediminis]
MTLRVSHLSRVLPTLRPPFLLLSFSCLLLAFAVIYSEQQKLSPILTVLVLLGGISAHMAVNALNEYFDYKSGLDATTVKTPFSGGSGTLNNNPQDAAHVLQLGLILMGVCAVIGLILVIIRGWLLLPVGIAGLTLIWFYTTHITRMPILCLIAPGLAFGPIMMMGSDWVLSGTFSVNVFITSLIPFFLVNNLLLLNQFPDIEADKAVGRSHFPIKFGTLASALIFFLFNLLAYLTLAIAVLLNFLPTAALWGMLTALLSFPASIMLLTQHFNTQNLLFPMALNVASNILTPLIIAVGVII